MNLDSPQTDTAEYPEENKPQTATARPVTDGDGGYFLNKFLDGGEDDKADASEKDTDTAPSVASAQSAAPEPESDTSPEAEELKERIIDTLREIYDPEIPVNIYEMGLIYDVDVKVDQSARVTMTLTTPHCPVAESMPGEVELKVGSVPGVSYAVVSLVWEPAWDMSRMSDEARLELGML
ncbi:hypothetical protein GCM10017044_03710 [Kordiimonas sediminis]|uniref:MIP18 family-like domain-containing protein n=1 Tax=Kordiimonas sediminis TaxID=1735581 RepID=A0A919E4S2_9PROT|nr:SUF system Fe-S cluster assembly protein [Kordiimonas sediminis]GHF12992.1 hypothetical protein GCM10017044_03710 [Kordiimonas sediminis]